MGRKGGGWDTGEGDGGVRSREKEGTSGWNVKDRHGREETDSGDGSGSLQVGGVGVAMN